MSIALTGNDLTFAQLYAVALQQESVLLSPDAVARMKASRAVVDKLVASGATAYGINTGFGKLASVRISSEQVKQLQVNLVRSHICGVGAPLSKSESRAMMLLRANALAKGLSGVRPIVVETLCAMLNAKVHPRIPSQGSVGASGDLAPLAHLAAVAIGEGRAEFQGNEIPGGEAMKLGGYRAAGVAGQRRIVLAERHARHAGAVQLGAGGGGYVCSTPRTWPRRFRSMRCAEARERLMRASCMRAPTPERRPPRATSRI